MERNVSETIIIEGSMTPCGHLARGERAEVPLTPHIQRLIDQGFVDVVSTDKPVAAPAPEPESEPDPTPLPTAPHKGASTAAWRAWLDSQTPPIEYAIDAGRDELVEIWEETLEDENSPEAGTSDDEGISSQ